MNFSTLLKTELRKFTMKSHHDTNYNLKLVNKFPYWISLVLKLFLDDGPIMKQIKRGCVYSFLHSNSTRFHRLLISKHVCLYPSLFKNEHFKPPIFKLRLIEQTTLRHISSLLVCYIFCQVISAYMKRSRIV